MYVIRRRANQRCCCLVSFIDNARTRGGYYATMHLNILHVVTSRARLPEPAFDPPTLARDLSLPWLATLQMEGPIADLDLPGP